MAGHQSLNAHFLFLLPLFIPFIVRRERVLHMLGELSAEVPKERKFFKPGWPELVLCRLDAGNDNHPIWCSLVHYEDGARVQTLSVSESRFAVSGNGVSPASSWAYPLNLARNDRRSAAVTAQLAAIGMGISLVQDLEEGDVFLVNNTDGQVHFRSIEGVVQVWGPNSGEIRVSESTVVESGQQV